MKLNELQLLCENELPLLKNPSVGDFQKLYSQTNAGRIPIRGILDEETGNIFLSIDDGVHGKLAAKIGVYENFIRFRFENDPKHKERVLMITPDGWEKKDILMRHPLIVQYVAKLRHIGTRVHFKLRDEY